MRLAGAAGSQAGPNHCAEAHLTVLGLGAGARARGGFVYVSGLMVSRLALIC